MNQDVACANCVIPGRLPTGQVVQMNRPMDYVGQYPVRGVNTFAFICGQCRGKVYLQHQRDPRTGRTFMGPVSLSYLGAEHEYQPNHVKPQEAVQIPVAYTLGQGGNQRQLRHHVQAQPLTVPQSGLQLDPRIGPGTLITPEHPNHPDNIRKRMQPVRLDEFA